MISGGANLWQYEAAELINSTIRFRLFREEKATEAHRSPPNLVTHTELHQTQWPTKADPHQTQWPTPISTKPITNLSNPETQPYPHLPLSTGHSKKKKKPEHKTWPGSQPTRKNELLWFVMLMLGGGYCLGLKRGENRWERRKRELRKIESILEVREIVENKILFKFIQYCYSAILHVEWHCSTILKIFTILQFYNSRCWLF